MIASAWALSLSGSLLLGAALKWLLNLETVTAPGISSAADLIGIAFVAPLLETLLLWPLLVYFPARSQFSKVVVAAILWGVLHALERGPIGLATTFAFGVFSVVFLRLHSADGPRPAVVVTTIVHSLYNITLVGLAYLISD